MQKIYLNRLCVQLTGCHCTLLIIYLEVRITLATTCSIYLKIKIE